MSTPPPTKTLLCALTAEERQKYGIQFATTLDDIETVEAEKKRQTDHFKDRISGLQASADELRRKVSTGQEWRDVEIEVRLEQPDRAHKQVVRLDTQEVIETRLMTEEDKQRVLPFELDTAAIGGGIEEEEEQSESEDTEDGDNEPQPDDDGTY